MKHIVFTLSILLISTGVGSAALEKAEDPNIIFAEVKQGQQILGTRDDLVIRLSVFDRAACLKTDQPVTETEYLQFTRQQVLAWTATENDTIQGILDQVKQEMTPYPLRFPPTVFLIKTSGKEQGGAAYTRLNAIILPKFFLRMKKPRLKKLITHELFHVYSRHNPKVRDQLYAAIGFQPCREIEYPPELRDLKITNPDAPCNGHYLQVTYQGSPLAVTPILYAREPYDIKRGGGIFHYMSNSLMGLERKGDTFQCKYQDGKPLLLSFDQVEGFYDQVGRNTSYNIHPEETLAENFVFLVQERKNIPAPEIIARMKTILSRKNHAPAKTTISKP